MTGYNNNRFTPGNKGNLKLFMNKQYLRQYYQSFITSQTFDDINIGDQISQDYLCNCIQQKANNIKQGWSDPSQTENNRISKAITTTLGGRIMYGNLYKPVPLNFLGGWEGQPGGSPRPLRNKF